MNKKRKIKERLLCRAFITVMLVSLFVGVSSVKASAAGNDHSHSGYTAITSSNVSKLSSSGSYYLAGNITISSKIEITSGQTVNLCLNGYTIKITGNDSLFYIDNGATLNIYDCIGTGVLTGGKGYLNGSQKGGAIYVRSSTLNMYGGTIKGNQAVWGGAVFIDGSNSTCTFNMYGGTISGNTAQSGGGGVEVEDAKSILNIYGGSIINNSVTSVNGNLHKGGGVHFAAGKVNIYGTYGDVIINNNTVAGVANNLYLRSGKKIETPNPTSISSNSSIGVSSTDCESGDDNVAILDGYGSNYNKCFFLDGTNTSSHLLVYGSNGLSIVKKASHTHSSSDVWYNDDTQHWHQCECGEKQSLGAHNISGQYSFDPDKHWYVCTTCGYRSQEAEHKFKFSNTIQEPSIEMPGIDEYVCENCGIAKTVEILIDINDAKITVENVNTFIYNGKTQTQKLKVYYDDELLSEGTYYSLRNHYNNKAGKYTLTIMGHGTFTGERTIDYEIKKAPLTVTANNEEITYGDLVPAYSVTYSGFVNDENKDNLSGILVLDCDYAQYSNPGNYDITATGYESNNYDITYVKGNVKVNKKVVGLDWSNLIFTYDGNAHLPTVTVTGLVNGDTCDVTVTGEGTDAGVYTATATALSNNNYTLPENATVEFVIQRPSAPEKVTSEDKEVIEKSLKILEDLLSEENVGNLTAEEKAKIEEQKADLEEKLKNIKEVEDILELVEGTINNLQETNGVTSDNKETIEYAICVIQDTLSGDNVGNLTDEEKATLQNQYDDLKEKRRKIINTGEKINTVKDSVSNLPEADEVTSKDKTSINDTLDIIEDLLSEENVGNLTAEEKAKILEQKADLEEKLGNIEAAEKKMETVENTASSLPSADEITSENKTAIEDALGIIEELLSEENVGNLTAREKLEIEKQKADLTEKLENIKATEQRLGMVENAVNNIPETNEVTSDNKSEIERALGFITYLLSEENVGKLTAEEKAKIEEQKADIEEKLGNIKAAEEKMGTVEDTVTTLPNADTVTSDNKTAIEDALGIIENLLSEEKVGNLTTEEKAKIEEQKAALEEKLGNIEAAEEKMETVEDTVTSLPEAEKVTSDNKTAIENALDVIEDLLSDENVGNLTEEEKTTVEEQKAALEEKLGNIEAAEEKMEAVEDTVTTLPNADEVTSENKTAIEDALDVIEDLLSEENEGNLTEEERTEIEEQKADLEEKLGNIKVAEEKMETVEDTVTTLPNAGVVTSDNKTAIEDALGIIENLLSEEKVGNLTTEEKAKIEEQKADLEEKLENIKAAEEKMETVEDTVTSLLEAEKVTSDNKTAIEDALDIIEDLLSEENIGNLTAEEKAEIEDQKADLEEKLDVIQIVEDTLDVLQSEKGNIPSKDVITTESKDEVVKLLDIIKALQENNPNNMTEEQKDVIECLREELQEKMERIQTIEDSLNEIENESASQPDYDDITSDNKEDIKDIIKDIENILKDENENLSQQEKDALKEQKNELENKVAFIEQIEKYEPVSGDFKNTTEPEINDLNADLDNDSNELIGIIPLEKTEKEHVAKSEDVKVYLEVSNITKTITEEAKELIETEVKDKKIAVYLDINLFKQIGEREPKKVPNTKGLVTITFKVPSNLVNTDNSVTRKYQVVRVHEGKVTIIDVVYDETTGMISFETDKFSTYAIVYKDVPVNDNDDNSTPGDTDVIKPDSNQKDEVPKTGGSNLAMYSFTLMFISGLGIVLSSRKRKTYCKEN